MATYPRVTRSTATDAVDRILNRHDRVNDPNRDRLSDNPHELLTQLRRHRHKTLPDGAAVDDMTDAIQIWLWRWWDMHADLRWVLDRADELGIRNAQLGEMFGFESRQGVRDLRDRLHGLFRPEQRRDEQLGRDDRRDAGRDTLRQEWRDENEPVICGVAAQLVDAADQLNLDVGTREVYLPAIADPVITDRLTAGYMLALERVVAAIPADCPARQKPTLGLAIRRADLLVRQHAAVGEKPATGRSRGTPRRTPRPGLRPPRG